MIRTAQSHFHPPKYSSSFTISLALDTLYQIKKLTLALFNSMNKANKKHFYDIVSLATKKKQITGVKICIVSNHLTTLLSNLNIKQ